ncbi:hypothetical protein SDRG_12146 [Saprolegnia diclina VS20]|uniref:Uncharacterized protein n=1 Tax=Saprolegnia diclina (strain VS20) TaxID=1156394 RepID=T0Q9D4_SAPDV|nr:hypothetical protein SDRG_12146 [Saprolegnia diclina VS20]EQC30085.1 hypothetical protein SDRG_12146 [Saprolegnia diclina VS20]|eukprot:XP_008616428.1 hypothetical protein SDRG_12146 [Saprolegnia diclina VS20]
MLRPTTQWQAALRDGDRATHGKRKPVRQPSQPRPLKEPPREPSAAELLKAFAREMEATKTPLATACPSQVAKPSLVEPTVRYELHPNTNFASLMASTSEPASSLAPSPLSAPTPLPRPSTATATSYARPPQSPLSTLKTQRSLLHARVKSLGHALPESRTLHALRELGASVRSSTKILDGTTSETDLDAPWLLERRGLDIPRSLPPRPLPMPHPRPQLPPSAKDSWDVNLADLATILSRYKHELEKLLDEDAAKAPPPTPTKDTTSTVSATRVDTPSSAAVTSEAASSVHVAASSDISHDVPEYATLPPETRLSESPTSECRVKKARIPSPGTKNVLGVTDIVEKPAAFSTEKWFISAPPISSEAPLFRFCVFDAPAPMEPHVLSLDFVPMPLAVSCAEVSSPPTVSSAVGGWTPLEPTCSSRWASTMSLPPAATHQADMPASTESSCASSRAPAIAIDDLRVSSTVLPSAMCQAGATTAQSDISAASSRRPRCVDDAMWPLPASVSSGYRQKQDHLLHAGLHHRLWSSKSSIAASTTTSI